MIPKYLLKLEDSIYKLNDYSTLNIKSVQCEKIKNNKESFVRITITLNDKNYDVDTITESFIKIQNNELLDYVPLFISADSNQSQQIANICFERFINKVMEITKYYHSLLELVFKL